ncbi:DUF6883 domain-containing protein [Microcoleus sp. D3_18a_C4]|uniref:DUF6883 domain-containing protein n=1 Tax=Microcoleus sp. D3_18a_C4 TaxID=3055332 RepID=UPI002FD4679D
MKIPADAIIPEAKLTRYLLVAKAQDDKSKFLAQGGFSQDNPEALLAAIQFLIASAEAVENGANEFGKFFRAEGDLPGANGRNLAVVTIWLQWQIDGTFHFLTLKPKKESRRET